MRWSTPSPLPRPATGRFTTSWRTPMPHDDRPEGPVTPEGGGPRRLVPPGVLAAIVLFMTIVLGGVAGLALDRTVLGSATSGRRDHVPFWALSNEDRRRHWIELSRSLKLTADQNAAIDSVLSQQSRQLETARQEIEPEIRQIMDLTRARIDSLLTPDQRSRLEQLVRERKARHHHQERQK